MGLLAGRSEDERSKLKQFRSAARGAGLNMNQLAYGTWRAMAADDPRKAAATAEQIDALNLSTSEKSAVDSLLSGIGVSA